MTMRLKAEVRHVSDGETTMAVDCRQRASARVLPMMPICRCRTVVHVAFLLLFVCGVSNALDMSNDVDALLDTGSSDDDDHDHLQVRKQWGLPDTTAHVGKLFRYHIPTDAFTGKVTRYEASTVSSEDFPGWLHFNATSSTLEGVPTSRDIGQVYFIIKAFGQSDGKSNSAQDVFSLDVLPYTGHARPTFFLKDADRTSSSPACDASQDSTSMSIVLDADMHSLTPSERIHLMTRLMENMGITDNLLHLLPYEYTDQVLNANTVMAGPGNARQKRTAGVIAHWQVGCNPWTGLDAPDSIVNAVEQSSRDGSLAEILGVPVVGWHLSVVRPQAAANRQKRQVPYGSIPTPVPGVVPSKHHHQPSYITETMTHEIYSEREETEANIVDEEEGPTPDVRIVPTMASPTFTLATTSTHHRHRHHHELGTYPRGSHHGRQLPDHLYDGGETHTFTATPSLNYYRGSLVVLSTPSPTPALPPIIPTRPTVQPDVTDTLSIFVPSDVHRPDLVVPTESTRTRDFTQAPTKTMEQPIIAPTSTSDLPMTTKTVTPDVTHHNFNPVIRNRIQKLSFIAGKINYFKVPADTFFDFEQGESPDLKLILTNADGTALHASAWLQFDAKQQAVYAIPLEENIGKWDFTLEAVDNEGDSVKESVEVHVRQHSSSRAVHHEFSLHLSYDRWRFPLKIDWEIKLVEKLYKFFGDRDASSIIVRSVTSDPAIFTWTNHSLLSQPCPRVMDLLREMATSEGSPTKYFRKFLAPEFIGKKILVSFFGNCMAMTSTATPTHINMKPEVPNQIDEIAATAGEFLSYKVPDDTFNDEEDGDARHLHLTFLTIDGVMMPRTYWLKFDQQQREFIGLPMDDDVGRREYQLVATDKNGSSVADALIVVVHPRPTDRRPSLEFSIIIDTDFEAFNKDLFRKVMVLDKLAHVFGDEDVRLITVHSITRGSVVYAWSNNTLPYQPCPTEIILQLVGIMFNENGTVSDRVRRIFSPDFNITGANAMPLGVCMAELPPTLIGIGPTKTVISTGPTKTLISTGPTTTLISAGPATTVETETETATSDDDIYVTTIIPAVVIAIMLLIAAIIACALYRKRRKGKMTMDSDNGNFVNKGIPIIFADELVDKPDPAKSPVILKEEKPPLPPPEYPRSSGSASPSTPPPSQQAPARPSSRRTPDPRHPSIHHPRGGGRGEDDHLLGPDPAENTPPYQPPPPFTASRDSRLSRPKHTPTYRLPPPYVPP